MNELEDRAEAEHVPLTHFAAIHVGLGDEELALQLYERAFRAREHACIFFKVLFHMDPLRDERRFQALIRQMDFPGE